MPTEVIHTVGAGGDYADLEAWETAQARNLVSADEIAVAEILAGNTSDTDAGFSGWTTDSTRKIIIRPVSGAEFSGIRQASGGGNARLTFTGSGSGCVRLASGNIELSGLEIVCTASSEPAISILSANNISIKNCFIDASSYTQNTTFTSAITGFVGRTGIKIQNCVVLSSGRAIDARASTSTSVYNCTIVGSGAGNSTFGLMVDASVLSDNNVVVGFVTEDIFGTPSGSNNATQDGSSGITISTSAGVDLTNAASEDYTPVSGGALDGAGTDLSAFFTDDITGATRTTPWDIGAFAIVGGASTTVAPYGSHLISRQFATIAAARLGGVLQ
jgi:hypothetical protein